MRIPSVRFTLGRLMALVSAIGIVIRLLMAAWEASPDYVYHVRQYEDTGTYTMRSHRLLAADEIHDMTYGSRFWHCALGLPLAGNPCRCKAHFEMVEGRRTTDVRTTFDRSLGNAFLDWFAANPKKLPQTDQELRSAPPRYLVNGVRLPAKKAGRPRAPSPTVVGPPASKS